MLHDVHDWIGQLCYSIGREEQKKNRATDRPARLRKLKVYYQCEDMGMGPLKSFKPSTEVLASQVLSFPL